MSKTNKQLLKLKEDEKYIKCMFEHCDITNKSWQKAAQTMLKNRKRLLTDFKHKLLLLHNEYDIKSMKLITKLFTTDDVCKKHIECKLTKCYNESKYTYNSFYTPDNDIYTVNELHKKIYALVEKNHKDQMMIIKDNINEVITVLDYINTDINIILDFYNLTPKLIKKKIDYYHS